MKHSPLLIVVLLAACGSGPDPSTTGGVVASVEVTGLTGYVGSAVLGTQGGVYLTANELLEVVRFTPSVALSSTWAAPATFPEIELAFSGGTVWWAANDGATSGLWSSSEGAFLSPSSASIAFPAPAGSDVVGLVADATSVYAAVSVPPLPVGGSPPVTGPSPDSWQWPGAPAVGTPFGGALYRIVPGVHPAVQPLAPTGGITFLPGHMQHVLAQSSASVYWVDSRQVGSEIGRVMVASKATWTTDVGRKVGGLQAIDALPTGLVGLAANESYVAWAAAPEPNPGTTGCWVWSSAKGGAPTQIFDSDLAQTSFSCNGLAVDDTYAYFAMTRVYVPPAGVDSAVVLGSGIARVPLAGGPLEKAPLESDRWYGPRRVLVDDTYVYAIDPSYVLRFPKTAFAP